MRKEVLDKELKELTFEFFYWFSRFEFSLKENGILKTSKEGANAEPGWEKFVSEFSAKFSHSEETKRLLHLNPKRQKVTKYSTLKWEYVGMNDHPSELGKVVLLVKTVRNNLFHGGKHGADGWTDPDRTKDLLITGKIILDQLAILGGIEGDYAQYY